MEEYTKEYAKEYAKKYEKECEKEYAKGTKNVVIIFGGASSEYEVSLQSAYAVIKNLNREKYQPILLGISRQGEWFYFTGDISKIPEDSWCNETDCVPAALSPDRTKHRLLIFREIARENGEAYRNNTAEYSVESIPVDAVFPILHGRNGEDGTVQGLVELAGMPLVGCGTLASAICMDKDRAHRLVQAAGVCVPRAVVLADKQEAELQKANAFAEATGYPLFVKPVKAGSSYGVTKVQTKEQLASAIALAFQYDNSVIIEENIAGFEVGCAVLGTDRLITGEVDEIELSGGFFDFTEKYTLKTSAIHVPARISAQKAEEIKETAKKIYRALNCSGFARVDCFLTPEGEVVFNEVNTIPGFTEHSRYPGMMKAAGYGFAEVLDLLLEQAVS